MARSRTTRRKILFVVGMIVLCLGVLASVVLRTSFPGQQASIALRLATGIGISALQEQIDAMEDKAIHEEEFTEADRTFLADFYTCLATGAKLTVLLGQSGKLMEHYLEGSGEPLALRKGIFTGNWKVKQRMKALKAKILADTQAGRSLKKRYASDTFHMPHPSVPDSVFGLYYGTIEARPRMLDDDRIELEWRAEVPWQWPSYDSLEQEYGDPHAESVPFPNPLCIVLGLDNALYVDNGLGEYLVQLELARPFVAYAEWDEVIDIE